MNNIIMSLLAVNLILILYTTWLQRKINRLNQINVEKERVLLQKELQIDALERREMIEINNRYDVDDLDERLRSKGYL